MPSLQIQHPNIPFIGIPSVSKSLAVTTFLSVKIKLSGSLHIKPSPPLSTTIFCMANQKRVKMVAKQIQRELSYMLLTDKVLQHAILPETALGADKYLSSLTTISDVQVSTDLLVVKVYVSIFGDDRGREVAMAGLKSKSKYVRSELGRRMKLRLTPEVRFIEDESLERGSRVIAILDKIKEDDDDGEWSDPFQSSQNNEDDADEGVIYVE